MVGIIYLWRIWITKDLLITCIKAVKRGSYLAIFLFGAAGPILLFGLSANQPTLDLPPLEWAMPRCRGFATKAYLKLKKQVLVITNYRPDQQQSMLRFGTS